AENQPNFENFTRTLQTVIQEISLMPDNILNMNIARQLAQISMTFQSTEMSTVERRISIMESSMNNMQTAITNMHM
ncbi:10908_t:CDS:2, partial [Dentiscutata heterogama]